MFRKWERCVILRKSLDLNASRILPIFTFWNVNENKRLPFCIHYHAFFWLWMGQKYPAWVDFFLFLTHFLLISKTIEKHEYVFMVINAFLNQTQIAQQWECSAPLICIIQMHAQHLHCCHFPRKHRSRVIYSRTTHTVNKISLFSTRCWSSHDLTVKLNADSSKIP